MIEGSDNQAELPRNTIIFCERPWKLPALGMVALILMTFAWGFYILDSFDEDEYFEHYGDMSVTSFLFRDAAAPDITTLYRTVPPAVVGIGGVGVNADIAGSGAIVGAAGYVLTTQHTINNLKDILVHVQTPSGIRSYKAQVVKTLASHDLVLLKMMTGDRFLFFKLADTRSLGPAEPVFGFGHGRAGTPIVRQGQVIASNMALTAEDKTISHLMRTDAVYSWEQNGGPLVNGNGELVGVNLAVVGWSGTVDGYAIPAHVIAAHFQDVVKFKTVQPKPAVPAAPWGQQAPAAAPQQQGMAPAPARAVEAAFNAQPGNAQAPPPDPQGSMDWWAMARSLVEGANQAIGINAAAPNGPLSALDPAQPDMKAGEGPNRYNGPAWQMDNAHVLDSLIMGFPIQDILGLAALAMVAGITGGMMTMGGGVLQVAGMLVFFGYGIYLIRPVAYLTNVFVYGAAAYRNNKAGLVNWDKVKALTPWAVMGVFGGYFLGNFMGDQWIGVMLGVFALLMAVKALQEIFFQEKDDVLVRHDESRNGEDHLRDPIEAELEAHGLGEKEPVLRAAGLGLPMGLVSGILGISGGVIEVPLQRYIGRVPLQNAIANSSVLVFWASIAGSLVAFIHGINAGLIDWQAPVTLAAVMIPGAYAGGFLGAKLMEALPVVALKWFYTVVMLAIAAKMLVL